MKLTIHSSGDLDHRKELTKQRDREVKKIQQNDLAPSKKRMNLIGEIKSKFKKLIRGTSKNLYLGYNQA